MNRIKERFFKFLISLAKKSRILQSFFESPINLDLLGKYGEFIDSYNNKFELYNGLRDKIKPGWQRMFNASKTNLLHENLNQIAGEGRLAVTRILPLIDTFALGLQNKKVLEIGCHLGAASYALTENGAEEVVGTDFVEYKVKSVGSGEKDTLNYQLEEKREKLGSLFKVKNRNKFLNDDICNTALPDNYFDLIVSWDVLEHLRDPYQAFINMTRLLKPGGIVISEYNSFFCLNGGHSLCTLDFLWGHVRLNEADFLRYLNQLRPNEVEKAFAFYKDGLNRMSISDMGKISSDAGLEIVSLFTLTKEQHMRMLDSTILSQCKNIYPNATAVDLVCPKIIVVHKKK